MSLNIEGVPVTDAEPTIVPTVAWMVADPSVMPVATPTAETVATVVTEELHVATAVMLPVLPPENVPVAVNCCVAPTGKERVDGAIAIDVRVSTLSERIGDVLLT